MFVCVKVIKYSRTIAQNDHYDLREFLGCNYNVQEPKKQEKGKQSQRSTIVGWMGIFDEKAIGRILDSWHDPYDVIKKMKWGDIDELTDEEFGYFG